MDLVPGQKLIYVPFDTRKGLPLDVTVARVGRKWAYLAERRWRVNDALVVDGGDYSSPGRCYGSWQDYVEITELHTAWDEFRRIVVGTNGPPDGVTFQRIAEARRALNILIGDNAPRQPLMRR